MAGLDSYVKLLLHSDTTNGATVFTDSSLPSQSIITGYGGISHSTAQQKFGASSIIFDATNDYLSINPYDTDFAFGTGDYTIDFWIWPRGLYVTSTIYFLGAGNCYLKIEETTGRIFYYNSNTATGALWNCTGTVAAETWSHIEVSRVSGVTQIFINGTSVASQSDAYNHYETGNAAFGYTLSPAGYIYAYIDEIRVSKGIGRHTTTFTPETEAYGLDPIDISIDYTPYLPALSLGVEGEPQTSSLDIKAYLPEIKLTATTDIAIWLRISPPPPKINFTFCSDIRIEPPLPEIDIVVSNPIAINIDYSPKVSEMSFSLLQDNLISINYSPPLPIISISPQDINTIDINFSPKLPQVNISSSVETSIDISFNPPMSRSYIGVDNDTGETIIKFNRGI